MKKLFAVALLAAAFADPAAAQEVDAATQARLDLVVRVGAEINDHDQSAWHVSDALNEHVSPDFAEKELGGDKQLGYITERVDADHVRTLFILTSGDRSDVLFAGVVRGDEVETIEDYTTATQRPSATSAQVQRLATTLKLRQEFARSLCGVAPNVIAFPALDKPDATDFYVLAPETETGVAQFGGHKRIRIGADGSREEKSYANSCISLRTVGSNGNDVAMLAITLPMDVSDIPTEIHVFKSLSHRLPIMVKSVKGYWEVTGDEISLYEAEDLAPQ